MKPLYRGLGLFIYWNYLKCSCSSECLSMWGSRGSSCWYAGCLPCRRGVGSAGHLPKDWIQAWCLGYQAPQYLNQVAVAVRWFESIRRWALNTVWLDDIGWPVYVLQRLCCEAILPAIVATDSPGWFVDGPLGAAHDQPRLQVLKYGILPESVVFSGAVLRSLGVTGVHSSSSSQT